MHTPTNYVNKNRYWIVSLVLLTMLAMSACVAAVPVDLSESEAPSNRDLAQSGELATTVPEINIIARDFAFDMPAEMPSGWVSLTLSNEGEVNHHGVVMRLVDGTTVEDVLAAMDDPEANQEEFSDLSFFLPDTGPGQSNQATVEMAPGHWVILSFSMDSVSIGATEEPTPDFLLGSFQEFDVLEAEETAVAPEADMRLTIGAENFDLPAEVEAGLHTIEVVNASGQENGNLFILKMEGDTTMDDILAMFDALFSGQEMDMQAMPVFEPVGGLMGYNLGDRYFTTVDLVPGNYTVVSSIDATEFPYSGFSKDFIVPGGEAVTDGDNVASEAIPTLLIEVSDDGIMVPAEAPGGIVDITINNNGEQMHTLDLWRIREGHTQDEIIALNDYLKENPDDFFGIFELGSWIHYADGIEPGASHRFFADLDTGDFFLSDETNPDLGPVFFSAAELTGVTEPTSIVTVDMADFSYAMPGAIPAGEQWWAFTNSGEQWHLAAIINANPDASLEEIEAVFVDGPPPTDAVIEIFGGMPPMSPGERVWLAFDLEPGEYEVVCPLPDVASLMNGGPPMSHMDHGMRRAFTVVN